MQKIAKQLNKIGQQGLLNKQNFNFSTTMTEKSFIEVSKDSPFPIQNVPFGVYQTQFSQKSICVAIGDNILDINNLIQQGLFNNFSENTRKTLQQENLNQFFALPKQERSAVREYIQHLLSESSNQKEQIRNSLMKQSKVEMALPVEVGDYTDFYASRKHAENVGEMFRGKDNKLMDNWLHMPIGYHGRASTISISKTLKRPNGQFELGKFGPEKRLDIELEMAMIVGGPGNQIGNAVDIKNSEEFVAGYSIMNDWSARQIQRVEYVPLGPFLGKSFQTNISPWVVLPEAIENFKQLIKPQPGILPYLTSESLYNYDIPLQVYLRPKDCKEKFLISESNMKNLYWTFQQMIAHHTVNGCSLRAGDMFGSGTISGENAQKEAGSLLELSWGASKPIELGNGEKRTFLEDGDTIILSGGKRLPSGQYIGFGDLETTVLPANIL